MVEVSGLCLVVSKGPKLELHSPSEAELKTGTVDAGLCYQSTGSTVYTGDPGSFLPYCTPLGCGESMTNLKKGELQCT